MIVGNTVNAKEKLGIEIASRILPGEVVGVGTGTTVDAALEAISTRVQRENLRVRFLSTSLETTTKCVALGLEVLDRGYNGKLSWAFDGADAFDSNGTVIKGRGGALLEEKILAVEADHYVIVADRSKQRKVLDDIPIPIEVVRSALRFVTIGLGSLGAYSAEVRKGSGKHGPIITENGNLLIDAIFKSVPLGLEGSIKKLVGVVDSGLFEGYADEIVVDSEQGVETVFVGKR